MPLVCPLCLQTAYRAVYGGGVYGVVCVWGVDVGTGAGGTPCVGGEYLKMWKWKFHKREF